MVRRSADRRYDRIEFVLIREIRVKIIVPFPFSARRGLFATVCNSR
jgi:hypothetical protein